MKSTLPLIQPTDVFLAPPVQNKKELLNWLSNQFARRQDLPQSQIMSAFEEREALDSTAIGQGIAIPHGRIKGLKQAHALFALLSPALPPENCQAPDAVGVDLVLALIFPPHAAQYHLETLARAAQIFSDEQLRSQIRASTSASGIYTLISGFLNAHPSGMV